MKTLTITNQHGTYKFLLDDEDMKMIKSLGRPWWVQEKREKPYARTTIDGKVVELHRLIMGRPEGKVVDHISQDTLDNRRSNLRVCSNADNLRNGRTRPNNTSGYKGVWWAEREQRWIAEIKVGYKKINIYGFKNFADALGARVALENEYWGAV